MNNSIKILTGFLGLLAVALVYAYLNWPRQSHVSLLPLSTPTAPVQITAALPSVPIDLQAPEVTPENATLVSHNIFAPLFTPPPQTSIPDIKQTNYPESVVGRVETIPPPRTRPVFLGKLQHAGLQRIFLSVEGEVYVVGLLDYFGPDNTYQLQEISLQSITVKHADDTESFQIEALEPPISVLSSSGVSPGPFLEKNGLMEANIPMDPGNLSKEVPIDNVIDE